MLKIGLVPAFQICFGGMATFFVLSFTWIRVAKTKDQIFVHYLDTTMEELTELHEDIRTDLNAQAVMITSEIQAQAGKRL